MRIGYSKVDSDVIAKMKGTFQERPKKAAADKGGKKSKKGVKVNQVNFFVFSLNSCSFQCCESPLVSMRIRIQIFISMRIQIRFQAANQCGSGS
jgi:hypothetical protein